MNSPELIFKNVLSTTLLTRVTSIVTEDGANWSLYLLCIALTLLVGFFIGLIGKVTIDLIRSSSTGEYSRLLSGEPAVQDFEPRPTLWEDILRNNLENLTPFFLVLWASMLGLSYFTFESTFLGVQITLAILTLLFFHLRLIHLIGMTFDIDFVHGGAFYIGALLIFTIGGMAIAFSAIGKPTSFNPYWDLNLAIAILIGILVFKLYVLHIWLGRTKRNEGHPETISRLSGATRNAMESLVPFAAIVALYQENFLLNALWTLDLDPYKNAAIALFSIYAFFRIIHMLCYAFAIQPFRSISYSISLLALMVLFSWTLAAFFHGAHISDADEKWYSIIFYIALAVEIFRTWILGFLTGSERRKTGNYAAFEDAKMPGTGDKPPDTNQAEKLNSFIFLHQRDIQLQLALWFILFTIGGTAGNREEHIAFVFVLVAFVVSRCVVLALVISKKELTANYLTLLSCLILMVLLVWSFVQQMIWLSS